MNILLLASHGIAEYDDIRMFSDAGFDIFCPGGYSDPEHPGETLRPSLPNAPKHPELAALCDEQRAKHAGESAEWAIDWAKADLHPDVCDWADAIIVHHFPERWIPPLLDRGKRVIWRTCGQSDPTLERFMFQFRLEGLEIVRYSPAERRYFESIAAFAGEDAVIRFGKYPEDYGPWIGDDPVVGNVTQHMVERGDACGLSFYLAATEGLSAKPAGPGSEQLPGGIGALDYDAMREYLRHIRAYLYTGTSPASYTLGLIEAMLSGVPVTPIAASIWAGPDSLFEGPEIALAVGHGPEMATFVLRGWLSDYAEAARASAIQRQRAVDLFSVYSVREQWREFLR